MTRHFQNEIEKLNRKLLHLTARVEENLQAAVRSVIDRDAELAQKVIDTDVEIDRIEVDVEEECLKILALHQPVAIDLRFIIAVLKINNDLERIGDLAENIAGWSKLMVEDGETDVPFDLNTMLSAVLKMMKMSSDALVELDPDKAMEVCAADDEVDQLHQEAYFALNKRIGENPKAARYYISLLSVSRNLERIADHATNIAEDIYYMVKGEIIRHQDGLY